MTSNLRAAARSGDVAEVRRLVAAGADKDAKDANGATALHCAADNGHVEVIKLLV